MDQFYFLLLFGLIALLRWLFSEGGLRKILTNLEGDLNDKKPETMRQQTSPTARVQPMPRSPASNESPEQKRLRKFREALGIPADSPVSLPGMERRSLPKVPPIIHQPLSRRVASERGQTPPRETKPLQRKAEPPVLRRQIPPALYPVAQEDHGVERYFQMENFDHPSIQVAAPGANAPMPSVASSASARPAFFGSDTDLRRMILAREILGPPKSLQIS